MLSFFRKEMVYYIKKFQNLYRKIVLLFYFPHKGLFEGFPELDTAAGKLPFMPLIPGL